MTRPYILCHMVTSLDGKVTGAFLGSPECAAAAAFSLQSARTEGDVVVTTYKRR